MPTLYNPLTGRREHYIIAQNPHDGLWYICGDCGRNPRTGRRQYMPISRGYRSRRAAQHNLRDVHAAGWQSSAAGLADL